MKRYIGRLAVSAAMGAAASAATLTIENKSLSVVYDDSAGSFSVVEKPSGSVFLKGGKLEGTAVKAKVEGVRDAIFGTGKSIVVTQVDGNSV